MSARPFIHDDFLLQTPQALHLYHEFAHDMPIIDYHCHLPPAEIAQDRHFSTMTELWLAGDHYKWRAMRTNGVDERFCTGEADDGEKFERWAATVPYLLRNPLYHWTHLELSRYFGIDELLGPGNARRVYEACNARLSEPGFSCRGLIARSNVVLICTTDDPVDSLEHHRALALDTSFATPVLPTWRPDKGMAVDDPAAFNAWLDRLASCTGIEIRNFERYLEAIRVRHAFFHAAGCRLSDHGLETFYAEDVTAAQARAIFAKVRAGKTLDGLERRQFKSAMLYEFGVMDHERGWTQQFHVGAQRNNNTRLFATLGPDTGFDSIGDGEMARPLARFLDRLDSSNRLARTILYNLNPRDNELIATMLGNFQDGTIPGKLQMGSGWWFLDQLDGMRRQLESLSQLGLLSRFVGMLTDSRSFLSYTRHEYFRRLLCNLLGRDMKEGLIPDDLPLVGGMVRDICYHNARRYFGFDVPDAPGGEE